MWDKLEHSAAGRGGRMEGPDVDTNNVLQGYYRDNIFGSYVHGIFDTEEFRAAFVSLLWDRKGIAYNPAENISYAEFKEQQYDKLAQILRDSIDMKEIYNIMGLEVE